MKKAIALLSLILIAMIVFIIRMGILVDKYNETIEYWKVKYTHLSEEYDTLINHISDAEGPLNKNGIDTPKADKEVVVSVETTNKGVCSTSGVKTYMDYKKITSKSSNQYIYIKKYMSVNDEGFLVDEEGRIGIALGSYFGAIGSKYNFTLSTGVVLKAVKVEAKSDAHTVNGCYQKWDKSVIEFVVDTDVYVRGNGNYSGTIESIEEVK